MVNYYLLLQRRDSFFFRKIPIQRKIQININDDIFIIPTKESKKRAIRFAEEIRRCNLKITFRINLRADSLGVEDENIIIKLKEAGLIDVFVGIEGGTNETLKNYNKKVVPSQNITMLKMLQKHDVLDPTCGFITFNPFTTIE
ncbi:hypothetical protein [Anoxybacter fermentans]|uniref:hypothetical protein n=1 Tax=Anoxybacter fermentans TaxID=1323375 RepID=UPI0013DF9BC5|nr:hypothetical protein [Anoxybacter fermentans]